MTDTTKALLRIADPALALYFRPGRNDHTTLLRAFSRGAPPFQGTVLDASHERRQRELRLELENRGYESILDPMALELATAGGWEREGLRSLEWAGEGIHEPSRFRGSGVAELVDPIAKFAAENRYNAVLAPTHFVAGVEDAWWGIDRRATRRLRHQLDMAGRSDVPIYYRLAISRNTLVDQTQRIAMLHALADLEIDGIWLCLHPVSARSGPQVLRSCLEISHDFSSIGVPVVAEKTGFLGLALMGFNAVGGAESSVTLGQGFDVNRLVNPPKPRDDAQPFGPQPRVYLDSLGLTLTRAEATSFFKARGTKGRFGCQDRPCCRSWQDMLEDPGRHFVYTRAGEVAAISNVPAHDRPTATLEWIRRASDEAVHAAKADPKKFEKEKRRLDGWRMALTDAARQREFAENVRTPTGRRAENGANAPYLH